MMITTMQRCRYTNVTVVATDYKKQNQSGAFKGTSAKTQEQGACRTHLVAYRLFNRTKGSFRLNIIQYNTPSSCQICARYTSRTMHLYQLLLAGDKG